MLRAGVTLVGAGALLVTVAGTATADAPTDTTAVPTTPGAEIVDPELLSGPKDTFDTELRNAGELVFGPLKRLPLHPLANTAVDPLNNSLGTQIGDFREISTEGLTQPLANGGSLAELPVVGAVTRLLPG